MPIIMQQLKSPFYWSTESNFGIVTLRPLFKLQPKNCFHLYSKLCTFVLGFSPIFQREGMHAAKASSACDNTQKRTKFASTRAVGHTKRMPSLSRVHVSHTFRWAYKSDLVKIFCYSLWNSLEKLSLENTKPCSGISILTVNNQVNKIKNKKIFSAAAREKLFWIKITKKKAI